ncbi:hypothetical protein J6590_076428 [Homalodisca vitripennis]|nr:hypothetical protein J6590_076428 [Homalodisca vitripennis]
MKWWHSTHFRGFGRGESTLELKQPQEYRWRQGLCSGQPKLPRDNRTGVERKFRKYYTTRSLSTRLNESSNEERLRQVSTTVGYSFVRDSFVLSKDRESQPKSQPLGFLEEDTTQRSRQREGFNFDNHEKASKQLLL